MVVCFGSEYDRRGGAVQAEEIYIGIVQCALFLEWTAGGRQRRLML